ncbi:hypothetical protein FPZ43_01680 [Mucilaginibacter pallidiroseus]|uniref:Uncharacterized protein n=1 Tax=Mucilaginibacter pallidiroseus TaxID=2599295 RepID=A0A563UIL6_9SPHI|nr:hypothetical protein [Mucilaginibacter pallidiroseus]TWR31212.1 hypothetical protein FPZ43_01680 [Mucilaginibacter pallidiroseus]
MKILKNLIGGLAGAVALNVLHEALKRFDHEAPRVDLIGEEAITKGFEAIDKEPPSGDTLYAITLAGDLISNAVYYSLIGVGKSRHLVARGVTYGAVAGIGALKLTEPLGLSDAPVTRTVKTQVLTVGYYTFGGLVTALVIKGLKK